MIRSRVVSAVAATGVTVLCLLAPNAASAKNCGDKYGQLTIGKYGGGVLILKHQDVSCQTVQTIGYALLRGKAKVPGHYDGFVCHTLPIQAGGGAAKCTRGTHLIEYGFE